MKRPKRRDVAFADGAAQRCSGTAKTTTTSASPRVPLICRLGFTLPSTFSPQRREITTLSRMASHSRPTASSRFQFQDDRSPSTDTAQLHLSLTKYVPKRPSAVETNSVRIHTWLALWHCGRKHLGVMDRGRASWDQDKPHTLGHHGNSFRCRWIDLAAVSADEGPCRRPPGMGGTGSDHAGWWGTDGVGFLRWSGIRAGSARSLSVYRPHTPVCRDLSRCR